MVFNLFNLAFPDFCDVERRPGPVLPPLPSISIVSMPMAEEVGGVQIKSKVFLKTKNAQKDHQD